MNTIKKFTSLFLVVILGTLCFMSCSKDNDEKSNSGSSVDSGSSSQSTNYASYVPGNWLSEDFDEYGGIARLYELSSNGTGKFLIAMKEMNSDGKTYRWPLRNRENITWTVSGDKLTIKFSSSSETHTIAGRDKIVQDKYGIEYKRTSYTIDSYYNNVIDR